METRVAVISVIVEKGGDIENLNRLLHEYGEYISGRRGLPYRQRNVNIISVVLDAPQDAVSALAGKIGNLPGVSAKTVYSGVQG
jgi:putative iron-only hydrogenase system regulator